MELEGEDKENIPLEQPNNLSFEEWNQNNQLDLQEINSEHHEKSQERRDETHQKRDGFQEKCSTILEVTEPTVTYSGTGTQQTTIINGLEDQKGKSVKGFCFTFDCVAYHTRLRTQMRPSGRLP